MDDFNDKLKKWIADAGRLVTAFESKKSPGGLIKLNQWFDERKRLLQAVAIVIALLALGFNGFQLKEAQTKRIQDERAWVFISEFEKQVHDDNSFIFMFKPKNFGKTPALNFRNVIYFGWPAESTRTNILPADNSAPQYEQVLAPGVAIDEISSEPIKNSIQTGYLWGTFWYEDIFGATHWSQYCYLYTNGSLRTTGFHNSCDTEQRPIATRVTKR